MVSMGVIRDLKNWCYKKYSFVIRDLKTGVIKDYATVEKNNI